MSNFLSGKQDVYLDVAERYARYIQIGVLKEGDRLPSVRALAGELGINPNTVQRAYTHLEEQGLIRSVPKKGAYVTGAVPAEMGAQTNPATEVLATLKKQGISKEMILSAFKEVYSDD